MKERKKKKHYAYARRFSIPNPNILRRSSVARDVQTSPRPRVRPDRLGFVVVAIIVPRPRTRFVHIVKRNSSFSGFSRQRDRTWKSTPKRRSFEDRPSQSTTASSCTGCSSGTPPLIRKTWPSYMKVSDP